ncbi:hypothetical protein, partial [[Eubacterium] cellulosolvens]
MKARFALIIIFMLLVPVFNSLIITGPITGKVTSFDDSEPSKEIEIPEDPQGAIIGNIKIPKRAVITNASMNVSVVSSLVDKYPKDVLVDIGEDGKYEWGFSGQGYGQMGQQQYFMDNKKYSRVKITGDSYNKTTSFRLPKNATVTSTMML